MKKLSLLLLPVLFFACKQSPTNINEFEQVNEITEYDCIYSDKEDALGIIVDIAIQQGILVTKHARDEYSFSFIDAGNGKMLHRWGKIGRGADEFLDFGNNFGMQDTSLVFTEQMNKRINHVSVADILGDSSTVNVLSEPFPYTADFRPMRFCLLDKFKVAVGAFKEGRLGVLDSENAIVESPFDYPFDCGEVTGIFRGSVFQSDIKSNNRQDKFVVSTFASDVFEIYQSSTDGIHRIYVSPYQNVPQVLKKGERYTVNFDQSIAGLMKMAVSDDLICFTYSSLSYTEAVGMDMESKEILCFDWEGRKIKKYILPVPISHFCVDERYIYGVRYLEDETVIYRFTL